MKREDLLFGCSASCGRTARASRWSLRARRAGDRRHRGDPVADGPGDQRDRATATAGLQTARRSRSSWPACCASASRWPAGWSRAGSRSASSTTCATGCTPTCSALELGFFDGQQTGQLMSRATVDLQAVRFFLGYGLIFIVQSLLTIVLAAVAMFVLNPAPRRDRARARCRSSSSSRSRYGRLAAGAAGGPAADRRAHRRGRGERLGRAHRQGVRPRGAPGRALPRTASPACSTSRCSRPGSAPSTRRSSASCPTSGSRRSSSSAAAR